MSVPNLGLESDSDEQALTFVRSGVQKRVSKLYFVNVYSLYTHRSGVSCRNVCQIESKTIKGSGNNGPQFRIPIFW